MDREDTIEKEQAGEERARTQVLRAQETGTNYESTRETRRQAEQELPSFSGSYDDEIGRLYDRIINREGFRYDMNSDPLYMSYRDRYAREGRLAMKNTMGQAAALTGGYGLSRRWVRSSTERIWKSSGTLCRSSTPRPTAAIRARARR